MKKVKVTIEVEQEKLEALETFTTDKNLNIEKELVDTFQKLYEKNVPAPVRTFIERESDSNKTSPSKPKKKDKPYVNEFAQEQKQ